MHGPRADSWGLQNQHQLLRSLLFASNRLKADKYVNWHLGTREGTVFFIGPRKIKSDTLNRCKIIEWTARL